MAGVNKVILVGRLGADPESRSLGQSGNRVVNLRLATSETWKDKASGERKERTEWHSVVIFNEPLGKIAEQYLQKGSEVYIEGQLETRKWTDKDGADRYSTEVVLRPFNGAISLIGGKSDGGGSRDRDDDRGGRSGGGGGSRGGNSGGGGRPRNVDLDDDIPFAPEFR
jgi:single-strand DNA-binding protein